MNQILKNQEDKILELEDEYFNRIKELEGGMNEAKKNGNELAYHVFLNRIHVYTQVIDDLEKLLK